MGEWEEGIQLVEGCLFCGGGREGVRHRWLSDSLKKVVGNGEQTSSWSDPWVEGGLLCNRFHRLFLLTTNKEETVAGARGWEEGRWVWSLDGEEICSRERLN